MMTQTSAWVDSINQYMDCGSNIGELLNLDSFSPVQSFESPNLGFHCHSSGHKAQLPTTVEMAEFPYDHQNAQFSSEIRRFEIISNQVQQDHVATVPDFATTITWSNFDEGLSNEDFSIIDQYLHSDVNDGNVAIAGMFSPTMLISGESSQIRVAEMANGLLTPEDSCSGEVQDFDIALREQNTGIPSSSAENVESTTRVAKLPKDRKCSVCSKHFDKYYIKKHEQKCAEKATRGRKNSTKKPKKQKENEPEKLAQCALCSLRFSSESSMNRHIMFSCKNNPKKIMPKCPKCHAEFNMNSLNRHDKICTNEKVKCMYCSKKLFRKTIEEHQLFLCHQRPQAMKM